MKVIPETRHAYYIVILYARLQPELNGLNFYNKAIIT